MNKLGHVMMIILPAAMLLVLCVMITTDVWWAYSLYIICAAALGACLAFAIAGMIDENQRRDADEDEEDELIELEEDEE